MKPFLKISTAFILFIGVLSCRNVPENEETGINNILTGKVSLVETNGLSVISNVMIFGMRLYVDDFQRGDGVRVLIWCLVSELKFSIKNIIIYVSYLL